MFSAFDPPELMTSCARRLQTIVPAQALTLLNSPLAREQAAAFARRILREGGGDPETGHPTAAGSWPSAGRSPTAEAARALEFLEAGPSPSRVRRGAHPAALRATGRPPLHRRGAMAELCLALFNANEFMFVD